MNTKTKKFLVISVAATLVLSMTAVSAGAATSKKLSGSLTFVAWGGAGQDKQIAGWLKPFTKKTGVTFKTDSPSNPAKVKAMVEAGKTTWDIIDLDPPEASAACGTLYTKRPAGFDMSEINPKYIVDACGVPVMGQTVALVYNKAKFGSNPPTAITDFLDLNKFPGQRLAFNYWVGAAELLLMADGVSPSKVYPLDWTRLNTVVKGLGSNLTFQNSLDEASQAMESGNFSMCLCFLGRAGLSAQNGAKIGVVWDKVSTGWDQLYAIKGSKNPTAQWSFLQYIATSAGQNPYYKLQPYSTTTKTAVTGMPSAFKPFIPENNKSKIGTNLLWDMKYLTNDAANIADQWTKLTSG